MSAINTAEAAPAAGPAAAATYPLIEAMVRRRSRRFALGNRLQGGAFSYTGDASPVPLAFQAHHVDTAFYDRFYRPGAYTETVAGHLAAWHPHPDRPA
jgi:hypothetical protein